MLGSSYLALKNGILNYSFKVCKEIAGYTDKSAPRTGKLLERMKKTPEPIDRISKLEGLAKLKEQNALTGLEFRQEKELMLKDKTN